MSYRYLINCLFFALLGQIAIAQDIDLKIPTRLSVCEQQSINFIISATNGPIVAGDLIVQFPCGMQYIEGSVEGLEFKEIDANGRVIFLLPSISNGNERTVSMSIFMDCTARACIDNGELFYIGFELVQGSDRIEILSDPFNVETGNLVIVRVDTLLMNGALHQTLTRRITVRNTRLGRIASFRFTDEYADQLQITQQTGNPITNQPGLRVSELRSEHFRQVGNRDGFLDFGEEIVIEQTIRIISCAYEGRFARSRWSAEWGCGGETCGSAQMQGQVNIRQINISGDVLSFTPTRREPACYYGGTAQQELRFNWSPNPLEIENLEIEIFSAQTGRGIVEGSIVADWADTIIYHNVRVNDCGQRITDRVSVRLKEMALFLASSRIVSWAVGFCQADHEVNMLTEHAWRYQYKYEKKCVSPEDQKVQTGRIDVGRFGQPILEYNFSFPDFGGAAISEGTIFTMISQVSGSRLTEPSGTLELVFEKPKFIILQNPTYSLGGKLPFSLVIEDLGDIEKISLIYNLPLSGNRLSLDLPAQISCALFIDAPCRPSVETSCESMCPIWADSKSVDSYATLRLSLNCLRDLDPRVKSTDGAGFNCWGEDCVQDMPGYLEYSFDVKRTSLGLPDKDNDGIPDEDGVFDYSQLELQHMIPGDTFEISLYGRVVVDELDRGIAFAGWMVSVKDVVHSLHDESDPGHEVFTDGMFGLDRGIFEFGRSVKIYSKASNTWFEFDTVTIRTTAKVGYFFYDLNIEELKLRNASLPRDFMFYDGDSIIIISKNTVRKNLVSTFATVNREYWRFDDSFRNLMSFNYRSEFIFSDSIIIPGQYYHRCNCTGKTIYVSGYSTRRVGGLNSLLSSDCASIDDNIHITDALRYSEGFLVMSGSQNTVRVTTNGEIRQKRLLKEIKVEKPRGIEILQLEYNQNASINSFINSVLVDPYYQDDLHAFFIIDLQENAQNRYFNLRLHIKVVDCIETTLEDPLRSAFFFEYIYKTRGHPNPYPKKSIVRNNFQVGIKKTSISNLLSNHQKNTKNLALNFILQNDALNGSNVEINYPFVRVVPLSSSIKITQIENSLNGIYLEKNGDIFLAPELDRNQNIPLTLHATSTSCQPEQLIIEYGYDCDVWTDPARQPCFLKRDTITIEVLPGLMDMQTPEELRQVDLCAAMSTQALYFNADLGHAYDVQAEVTLPRGMRMVPGSAVLIFPAGSGNELPMGDPEELGVRHFRWKMDEWMEDWIDGGLPGVQTIPGNDFEIRFDVETDCSYISGTRIVHTIMAHKVCGQRTNRSAKVEAPIQITGVTAPYTFSLQASTLGSGSCGSPMIVQATLNVPSGQEAGLYLTLPTGMEYVSGTAMASNGLSGETRDGSIWSWKVQAGEGPTTFTAEVLADADCQEGLIELFATAEAEAICAATQQACPIEVVTGSRLLPIKIEKPSYSLVDVDMLLPEISDRPSRIQVGLQHTGVLSPETPVVDLYLDNNGNGSVDAGDNLLQTLRFNVFNTEGERQVRRFDLPDLAPEDYCRLLLDVSETNNCICEGQTARLGSSVRLQGLDADLCHNESVTIGVPNQAGYRYQWNDARGLSCTQCAEAVFQDINNGIFTETYRKILRAESPDGCIIEYVFDLRVQPRAEILTGDLQVCAGEEVELIANIADAYHWIGDNITENGQQILRVIARQSGYYYLEAGGLPQCDNRDSVYVEVLPSPASQFPGGIDLCFGGSGELGIIPEPGVRYEWVNGSGRLSALDIANPSVLIEESFVFQLISENAVCRTISEIPVLFYKAFEIGGLPSEAISCVGDTVFLSLNGGVTYMWEQDVTNFCRNPNCSELVIPVAEGRLELSVEARDEEGCVAFGQIVIEGTRDTLFQSEEKLLCEGDEWIWQDRLITASGVYCDTLIIAGGCLQISCVEVAMLPLAYEVEEVQLCEGEIYEYNGIGYQEGGFYCFTASGVNGCDSTHCLSLEVRSLPEIPLELEYEVWEGAALVLELPAGYASYEWSPLGIFDCSTCPTVTVQSSKDVVLRITVRDELGCTNSKEITLRIKRSCTAVNTPMINAFSPNEDGQNDTYRIDGLEDCGRVDIRIFNRWGNEVYRMDGYDNSWKGEGQNGNPLPQGTYYVVLDYRDQGLIRQGSLDLRRR